MKMRAFVFLACLGFSLPLLAQSTTLKPSPSLEQRVADLEAYVNNGARGADAPGAQIASSNIPSPGPGHNAWLDTFGAHAVGGTHGALLTGFLATVNSNLTGAPATQNGLAKIVGHTLWLEQLKAMGITLALALIGTAVIGLLVRGILGLRVSPDIERRGIDLDVHGEQGYIPN